MTTAPCPCGGATYVDEFIWPERPQVFFVRCGQCWAKSSNASTEAEAAALQILPEDMERAMA